MKDSSVINVHYKRRVENIAYYKLTWIGQHPLMKSMKILKIAWQPKYWPIWRDLIKHMGCALICVGVQAHGRA